MARSVGNAMLDAALDYLADNGTRADICATEPTTYAEATSTNSLGNVTLTAGAGNGDWSAIANGDVSGRKITLAAQTGISIGTTGTADHLAITDGTSELIYVFAITSQAVSSGGNADTDASDVELEDPAAS